jgi:hypothetical protein
VSGFVIEDGIPIPPKRPKRPGAGLTDAARSMEVGQSLLVPGAKSTSTVAGTLYRLRPMRYTSRKVEGGVRIWRVE